MMLETDINVLFNYLQSLYGLLLDFCTEIQMKTIN
jgi:hypothetical protein